MYIHFITNFFFNPRVRQLGNDVKTSNILLKSGDIFPQRNR